VEIQYASLT